MSADQHSVDAPGHADAVAHHPTDDHGDDHGHDDHAHGEEPLGPIDVAAWGAGLARHPARGRGRVLFRARDDPRPPDPTEPAGGLAGVRGAHRRSVPCVNCFARIDVRPWSPRLSRSGSPGFRDPCGRVLVHRTATDGGLCGRSGTGDLHRDRRVPDARGVPVRVSRWFQCPDLRRSSGSRRTSSAVMARHAGPPLPPAGSDWIFVAYLTEARQLGVNLCTPHAAAAGADGQAMFNDAVATFGQGVSWTRSPIRRHCDDARGRAALAPAAARRRDPGGRSS